MSSISLWYLDDGTFIESRSFLHALLSCFTKFQLWIPFGLHINPFKCELYWPCGDSSYPGFPIKHINSENSGLELLGSPVWGPPQFYDSVFLPRQIRF